MIDYLYSSKSIGVRNYTHELYQHMSDLGVKINMCGAGGRYVLSHMDEQQLREHLIERLPGSDSTVLHVQHDTLLFRGAGDMMDGMGNMCWFLEQMLDRYEQVFITFHGRVEFEHVSWLKQPVVRMLINMLSRTWYKQVIPMLNKCTVLVHSLPHVKLLESQGCNTVQLFTHPTSRHTVNKPLDVENIRVVVPGRLVDRKRIGLAIETCTRIPNCTLTIDSSDMSVYKQWEHVAESRSVRLNPVKWSINTAEYLEQLSQHDVALVMYTEDVPLSGSVIDALRCGLIVGATVTPSFQWFADEFQCITTHNNSYTLGDTILDLVQNTIACERSAWHADNYFDSSCISAKRLVDVYSGAHVENQNKPSRTPVANAVTKTSRQITSMPSYMINTSECAQLKHVDGMLHVEHQYRHDIKSFSRSWSGLLHGPFFESKTTLFRPTVNTMLQDDAFDNCTKLQVTNSKLKEIVESYVSCPVEVNLLKKFPPVKTFDIEAFVSQKKHILLHAGWWCKNFESFNQLRLNDKWTQQIHVDFHEPTRELLDMYNLSGCLQSDIPNNCLYYINQSTDDVVDEQMLHCMRSNTPMLVHRNATTQEYLGTDYPLMFDDIKQAGELLTDENIIKAIQYLK